jgi:hypothetical protein
MYKKIIILKKALLNLLNMEKYLDDIKINQGLILSKINQNVNSKFLSDYEYKIFSQWGEDGILQHLISNIKITNKTFIEFGVETFEESNCRFLMQKDNWSGLVIDGSTDNIKKLKNRDFYWKHDLNAIAAFITTENINELIKKSNFDSDIGILSIDLDGNDYHIWECIDTIKPRIVVCEYNAVFGLRKISTPYSANFNRTKLHYSNLFFGASITALEYLASKKGYSLVGTTSTCGNAFFLRNDLINCNIPKVSSLDIFKPSKERQSRDRFGNLNFLSGDSRLEALRGLEVINVENDELEYL